MHHEFIQLIESPFIQQHLDSFTGGHTPAKHVVSQCDSILLPTRPLYSKPQNLYIMLVIHMNHLLIGLKS